MPVGKCGIPFVESTTPGANETRVQKLQCVSEMLQSRCSSSLHIGKKTRRPAKIEIRVLGNTYLFKERQRQMTFDVIVDAGCIIPARTAVDDEQMAVPEGRDETTSCSSKSVMRFIASRMDPPNVARRTLFVSAVAYNMASSGVTPMPALNKTTGVVPVARVNVPRGALASTVSPTCTCSLRNLLPVPPSSLTATDRSHQLASHTANKFE